MTDNNHFTLVFEGDLRKVNGNPFKINTPYGRPIATGVGNAFDMSETRLTDAMVQAGAMALAPLAFDETIEHKIDALSERREARRVAREVILAALRASQEVP